MKRLLEEKFLENLKKAEEYSISETSSLHEKRREVFNAVLSAETLKDLQRYSIDSMLDCINDFDVLLEGTSAMETMKKEVVQKVKKETNTFRARLI